ncbi:MAG: ATP-binding cassette domain-containing protein [Burkholderiaceae bacterium]
MTVAPTEDPAPLVVFDHVIKRYGAFRLALSEVSFAIGRSELVLLAGPSGAGKSTALRLIAALDVPTSGRVVVGGEDIARLRPRAVPFLRRSMGIVLQDPMLLDDRSVLDNVMLPALASGLPAPQAEERARAALTRVGLDAFAARPQELSGGEQQRAALARAIVNRPALMLVDEPTAHLDPASAAGILQLLEQFAVAGVTVIVASHGESFVVPARARTIRLDRGKIVE